MGIPAEHLWERAWRNCLSVGAGVPQGGERMERKWGTERLLLPTGALQTSVLCVSSLHSRWGCRLSNKSFAISSAQCSLAKTSLSAEAKLTHSAKCSGLHEHQGQHDLNCVQTEMGLSSMEKWTAHSSSQYGCLVSTAQGTTVMANRHGGGRSLKRLSRAQKGEGRV